MASGSKNSHNQGLSVYRYSHGVWLLSLVLLTLCACCSSEQARLTGYRPDRKYNGMDDQGIFNVPAGSEVTILLFGDGINDNTFIQFTEDETSCGEHMVEKINGGFASSFLPDNNMTNSSDIQYSLTFTLTIPNTKTYYFCIDFGDGIFKHQGVVNWLAITIQIDILPLWAKIIFIIILMIMSGLFSGLNLGLMALDPTTLKIIKQSGTKRQRTYANIIFRVRKHGNYLLCTLLLGNVIVNSTLTILLDEVLPSGVYAVIVSTLAIVIFGEIIPQAICSRHGLVVGAWTIPLTLSFMLLTLPLSLPLSLILNLMLGKEIGAVYNREQLLKLLDVTQEHHDMVEDEVKIISGVLAYKEKVVSAVMTKFEDVYCVNVDSVLDFKLMREIYDSGFSRIPIYEKEKRNIVGLLYVRDLAFVDPDDQTAVQAHMEFYKHDLHFVWHDNKLGDMLKVFVSGRCHIAVVQKVNSETDGDPFYENIGVVTLEDIIEEILQQEIVDETDRFIDNESKKLHKRKNFNVGEFDNASTEDTLSSQQRLAVYQFLSTAVEPFKNKYISHNVLKRLLTKNVVRHIPLEASNRTNLQLYSAGKEASFFTLILEGCMEVLIGKDELKFDSKSFTYFGAQALLNAATNTPTEYVPDYTVRPSADSTVIIITKRQYLAAMQASQFEEERAGPILDVDRMVIQKPKDVFAKEWERAEDQDLQDSHSTGLSSITRFLSKKNRPMRQHSDKCHLLKECSDDSSESQDSVTLHTALTQKHSMNVMEDRGNWLTLSNQNGESSVTRSDSAMVTEMSTFPDEIRSYESEPNTTAYLRTREDWALNTSTEV